MRHRTMLGAVVAAAIDAPPVISPCADDSGNQTPGTTTTSKIGPVAVRSGRVGQALVDPGQHQQYRHLPDRGRQSRRAPENSGEEVNAAIYRDGGNGSNDDASDFIAWIATITGFRR